jgi:hypothetical protein
MSANKAINVFPHNLTDLDGRRYVFDDKQSGIRALPGHRVSFVLPKSPKGNSWKTSIFYGNVTFLDFNLDDMECPEPIFNKNVVIHGVNHRIPKDLEAIHEKGIKAAKLHKEHLEHYVPGAEVHEAPRVLSLGRVHISISVFYSQLTSSSSKKAKSPVGKEDFITEENLKRLLAEIRKETGRDVSFVKSIGEEANQYIISIPINWVVQDLTALEAQKGEKILPQIVEPIAFPSIGTRVIYLDDDGERAEGKVSDFGIVEAGDLIQILLESPQGEYSSIVYSNMYVDSEEKMLHPSIVRAIGPEKLADPKAYYHEDGCEIIRRSLSKWIPLSVTKLCILATEETENSDSDRGSVVRTKWIRPEYAIGNPNINVVSFQHGKAQIKGKGKIKNIVNLHKNRDEDFDPENDVDIASIKSFKDVKSFVCNAANGTMALTVNVNGKKKVREAFFDTRNGVDISTRRLPLFAGIEPNERVSIDAATFRRALGYITRNKDPNHQDQDVAVWSSVPQAFVYFYKYVASRGQDPDFENKTVAQVRQMLQSDEYPTLVDIYNFIQYGFGRKNQTSTSEWSRFFAEDVLGYNVDDLRD